MQLGGPTLRQTYKITRYVMLCAGLSLLASLISATAAEPETTPAASIRLSSETHAITPGKPFKLIVELTVPKGWHTYWLNPGETGMAPTFTWELPLGVSLAALHFPVPQRFDDEVNISLGYTGTTRLLADFKTTPEIADSLNIGLKVSWMICREMCLPITSRASLTLPQKTLPSTPLSLEMTQAEARKRLPQAGNGWKVTASRDKKDLLRIDISPPKEAKLPPEAWQKAWVFPLEPDLIDLSAPPLWQPTKSGWTARVKPGFQGLSAGKHFEFVLAFPTLSDTGWLLKGVVN